MTKILELTMCAHCMFFDLTEKHCVNSALPKGEWPKEVEDKYSIPDWCPLPDKEEKHLSEPLEVKSAEETAKSLFDELKLMQLLDIQDSAYKKAILVIMIRHLSEFASQLKSEPVRMTDSLATFKFDTTRMVRIKKSVKGK